MQLNVHSAHGVLMCYYEVANVFFNMCFEVISGCEMRTSFRLGPKAQLTAHSCLPPCIAGVCH